MNKFNSNNVTTLAKNKRNTALKRYLTVAITCAIVGVAMLPVMADSDAETAINNMSDIIFGIIRAIGIILSGWGLPCRRSHYRLRKVYPDCYRSRRVQLI